MKENTRYYTPSERRNIALFPTPTKFSLTKAELNLAKQVEESLAKEGIYIPGSAIQNPDKHPFITKVASLFKKP